MRVLHESCARMVPCNAVRCGVRTVRCSNIWLVAAAAHSAAKTGITRPGTVEKYVPDSVVVARAEGALASPAATARRAAASVAQQEEEEEGEEAGDDAATAPPPTTRSVH